MKIIKLSLSILLLMMISIGTSQVLVDYTSTYSQYNYPNYNNYFVEKTDSAVYVGLLHAFKVNKISDDSDIMYSIPTLPMLFYYGVVRNNTEFYAVLNASLISLPFSPAWDNAIPIYCTQKFIDYNLDNDSMLWFIDPINNTINHSNQYPYMFINQIPLSLIDTNFGYMYSSLFVNDSTSFFLGTEGNGIFHYNGLTWNKYMNGRKIHSICKDKYGDMWVLSDTGIIKNPHLPNPTYFSLSTLGLQISQISYGKISCNKSNVFALIDDSFNVVVVNLSSNQFKTIDLKQLDTSFQNNRYLLNTYSSLRADEHNRLWFACSDDSTQLTRNAEVFYLETDSFNFTSEINNMYFDENSLHLFPNPAFNEITIEFHKTSYLSAIELYNSLGVKVKELSISKYVQSVPIDLADLPVGIYFLRLQSEHGLFAVKKFIRQ